MNSQAKAVGILLIIGFALALSLMMTTAQAINGA